MITLVKDEKRFLYLDEQFDRFKEFFLKER